MSEGHCGGSGLLGVESGEGLPGEACLAAGVFEDIGFDEELPGKDVS